MPETPPGSHEAPTTPRCRVVLGLGNPGARYDPTRHNVGWWLLDRIAYDRGFGAFQAEGPSLVSGGQLAGASVSLVKPQTWMNRSGAALLPWMDRPDFDPARDLLVVVDDATRPVGGVRFRPGGSHGGHNGLRSLEGVLGHRDFARLRIGVGVPPPEAALADWVLSPPAPDEEEALLSLLPELVKGVERWVAEGVQPAMNAFNR